MTRKTLNIAIAAALFGSLALVGCKKKQDDAAMAPPATTEPAPPPDAPAGPPRTRAGADHARTRARAVRRGFGHRGRPRQRDWRRHEGGRAFDHVRA